MYRKILLTLVAALAVWQVSSSAIAQPGPYYAKGDFNAYGLADPLTDMGGGHWQGTVTGLTDGNQYEYKLANADWSEAWPGSNGKIQADASGNATFNLYLTPPADGWSPAGPRVGYNDLGIGWEIMGDFNGFTSPVVSLTDMGGGLYEGDYTVATAGTHDFKFRKAGDWSISIGDDFGNAAGNAQFTTSVDNQQVTFQLDLPGGRWNVDVQAIPEPSTLLLSLSGLVALAVRRRR